MVLRDVWMIRYKIYFQVRSQLLFVAIVELSEDFPALRVSNFLKSCSDDFVVALLGGLRT